MHALEPRRCRRSNLLKERPWRAGWPALVLWLELIQLRLACGSGICAPGVAPAKVTERRPVRTSVADRLVRAPPQLRRLRHCLAPAPLRPPPPPSPPPSPTQPVPALRILAGRDWPDIPLPGVRESNSEERMIHTLPIRNDSRGRNPMRGILLGAFLMAMVVASGCAASLLMC